MNQKIKRVDRNQKPPRALRQGSGQAIEILIFWSFVPEWWSKMIVRITGNQLPDKSDSWSHMGVIFQLEDGTSEYYEALFEEGFVGPKPVTHLIEKIAEKQGKIKIKNADVPEYRIQEIYERCKSWVGKQGYYQWQLAFMWFFERIGRFVGFHIPRSPDKTVCSEAVARLVGPPETRITTETLKVIIGYLDLRDEERDGYDEVNPNSAWRKYLELSDPTAGGGNAT